MKTVITYGTFDLFHVGHLRLLERAKALAEGGKLYVGVTSENYDRERGKLNVQESVMARIDHVRASGFADEVFVEEYEGQKIEDIQRYGIDIFAIGSDWEGVYDYLSEWCKVVYLPRTAGVSSSMIRNDDRHLLRAGAVGCGRIANRFLKEAAFVSGIVFEAVCNPDIRLAQDFAERHALRYAVDDFEAMLQVVDVVYVATPHLTHAEYVRRALEAGKHVLCEKPMTLDVEEAASLYRLAGSKGVLVQEALKTAFAPGFRRLINLVKGGVVGRVRQISATFTKLTQDHTLREFDGQQGGGAVSELASYVLCPIVKLLGPVSPECMSVQAFRDEPDGVETFVSGLIRGETATGLFTVGLSAKSEGCLTIAGTKGYIWVPSPWWKTEYFEIRDDLGNPVRRVFSPLVGDGLRYELADFVNAISSGRTPLAWTAEESLGTLKLLVAARHQAHDGE